MKIVIIFLIHFVIINNKKSVKVPSLGLFTHPKNEILKNIIFLVMRSIYQKSSKQKINLIVIINFIKFNFSLVINKKNTFNIINHIFKSCKSTMFYTIQ